MLQSSTTMGGGAQQDEMESHGAAGAGNMIDTGSNNNASNTNHGNAAGGAMVEDSVPTSVEDDQNYQFYKEYCRLYYANIILTNRLQQLLNEKKDLQFKLSRLEVRRE